MNLGQFLTAKSPLPSGTVAQHLAAIAALQVGSGQGTVFVNMFSVAVETPSLVVTRKAKRQIQEAPGTSPVVQRQSAKPQKNVAVFSAMPSATTFTAPDEITVFIVTQRAIATTKLGNETITRKRLGNAIN